MKRDQGSVALVLVLVTIALISAIVLEMISSSQTSATIVANRRDAEKAYGLALAAFRWSLFRLQLDSSLDKIPAIPNTNYGGKKDDLLEFQWAFPIPYPFIAEGISDALSTEDKKEKSETDDELSQGSFVSAIFDESAKINLNDVGSGGPRGQQLVWSGAAEVLENLILSIRFRKHFDPYVPSKDHREILWAIEDWTDQDSAVNHLGGGIEDSEYRIDGSDVTVKNAPFFSVAELRMLKPMTEDLYRDLLPFVTVYPFNARLPRVSTQNVQPLGGININTAPMEIIAALIARQVMPDERPRLECAQKVVQYRSGRVFRQPAELGAFMQQNCDVGGQAQVFSTQVNRILRVSSETFSIEASSMVEETERKIQAVVSRLDPQKPQVLFWKVL